MELHTRNEISQLVSEDKYIFTASGRPYFCLYGVDYYPSVSDAEIPTLLNQGYEYLVFDAGTVEEHTLSEFLRCDHKLILGSLAPWKSWKYHALLKEIANNTKQGKGFEYLAQAENKKERHSLSKMHHINIHIVPFIRNPFSLEKEVFPFLGMLSTEQ